MDNKWKELAELSRLKLWETAPQNATYYAGNRWYTKDLMAIVDDIYYGRALVQSGYNSVDHLKRDNRDFMEKPENMEDNTP